MALSINLTLIVQALHFMLAYAVISRVLLKPAYKVLHQELKHLAELRSMVVREQERLALRQEDKKQGWRECQRYFYTYKPTFERERMEVTLSIEPLARLTKEEKTKLTQAIAAVLKQKVVYD
jgi:hypothetical protein